MLLDFEEHRDHRRIMQQSFTRSALDGYLALTSTGIVQTLNRWFPAQRFPMYPSTKHLLLRQAAEVFIGTELGPEADQLAHDFHDTARGGQAIIRADVRGGTWARGLRARERLEKYFTAKYLSAEGVTARICFPCSAAVRATTVTGSPIRTSSTT